MITCSTGEPHNFSVSFMFVENRILASHVILLSVFCSVEPFNLIVNLLCCGKPCLVELRDPTVNFLFVQKLLTIPKHQNLPQFLLGFVLQFVLQLQIFTFLVPCWVQGPYLRDSLGRSGSLIEVAH